MKINALGLPVYRAMGYKGVCISVQVVALLKQSDCVVYIVLK